MQDIRVSEVSPGMIVSKDICDRSGRLLIASGTVLNNSQIRILKTWGITNIVIAGEQAPENLMPNPVSEQHLEAARKLVEEQFRFNFHDQPVVAELERIVTLRLANEMATQNASRP